MPFGGQGGIGGPCNLTEAQVPCWVFLLFWPRPFRMRLGQGLLIRLDPGSSKMNLYRSFKVFLVPPGVVVAEVNLVVVQMCSFLLSCES